MVYLKDDSALTDYLFSQGAGDLRVDSSTGRLEGAFLIDFLSSVRALEAMLEKVTRRFDDRVVHAFLEIFGGDLGVLKDKGATQDIADRMKERLQGLYSPDNLRLTRLELEHSADFDAWEIHVRTRQRGVDRQTHIGWNYVQGGDFREVQRLHQKVVANGTGPYTLHRGKGEPLVFATERDLYARVDSDSRKGYDIQRYKGLGEMNPDQLWETTMDPGARTLLQVKVDDLIEADEIFTLLMGEEVEPRREFIQSNALSVQNLDV